VNVTRKDEKFFKEIFFMPIIHLQRKIIAILNLQRMGPPQAMESQRERAISPFCED